MCVVSLFSMRKVVALALLGLDGQKLETWPSPISGKFAVFPFTEFCDVLLSCCCCVALYCGEQQVELFLTALVKQASSNFSAVLHIAPSVGLPAPTHMPVSHSKAWPLDNIRAWKADVAQGQLSAPPSPVRSVLSRVRSRRASLTKSSAPQMQPQGEQSPTKGALESTLSKALAAATGQERSSPSGPLVSSHGMTNDSNAAASDGAAGAADDYELSPNEKAGAIQASDVARWHRVQWNTLDWPPSVTELSRELAGAARQCSRWKSHAAAESSCQEQAPTAKGPKESAVSGGSEPNAVEAATEPSRVHKINRAQNIPHPIRVPVEAPIGLPSIPMPSPGNQEDVVLPRKSPRPCSVASENQPAELAKRVEAGETAARSSLSKVLDADKYTQIAVPASFIAQQKDQTLSAPALNKSIASFGRSSLKSQFIDSTAKAIKAQARVQCGALQHKIRMDHTGLYLGAEQKLGAHSGRGHGPASLRPSNQRSTLASTTKGLLGKSLAASHSQLLSTSKIIVEKANPRLCYSQTNSLQLLPPQSPPGSPYESEILRFYVHEMGNQGRRVLDKTGALALESSKVLLQPSPYSSVHDSHPTSLPALHLSPVQTSLSDARKAAMLPWDASASFQQDIRLDRAVATRGLLLKSPPFAMLQEPLGNGETETEEKAAE